MNSTQRQDGLRRAISQPAPATRKILSESDVQNRIAAIQARDRKQAAAALRSSHELQVLKTEIIDQWVDDASAGQTSSDAACRFATSPLSADEKAKVLGFARQHLAPSASDDATTREIKRKTLDTGLIKQCLGLRPLAMRVPEQGMLELAFGLIADAPFIEEAPEYAWLKQAVERCPAEIARVDLLVKAGMKLVMARALQKLLQSQPHRIAARDSLRGIGPVDYYLSDVEVQRFIAGVERLVNGEDVEELELKLVERFAPRLQRHVPTSMLADFANFVDLLNLRREQARV